MMVAMVTMLLLESHLFSFRFFYNEMVAPYLCFDGPVPNQLYVIGGRDNNQEPLDVVEMFDAWNGRPGQVLSELSKCEEMIRNDKSQVGHLPRYAGQKGRMCFRTFAQRLPAGLRRL